MFVVLMMTFFAWSRETRSSSGMGWLESARRANLARMVSEGATESPGPEAGGATGTAGSTAKPDGGRDVDDDEHLAAYNAYLERLNKAQR
jgi:hypothetical protein